VSGYKLGVTARKKQHRIRDMLRRQKDTFQPRALRVLLLQLLRLHRGMRGTCQRRGQPTRRDAVHPNTMRSKLRAGRAHEPLHRVLRHHVVGSPQAAVRR